MTSLCQFCMTLFPASHMICILLPCWKSFVTILTTTNFHIICKQTNHTYIHMEVEFSSNGSTRENSVYIITVFDLILIKSLPMLNCEQINQKAKPMSLFRISYKKKIVNRNLNLIVYTNSMNIYPLEHLVMKTIANLNFDLNFISCPIPITFNSLAI